MSFATWVRRKLHLPDPGVRPNDEGTEMRANATGAEEPDEVSQQIQRAKKAHDIALMGLVSASVRAQSLEGANRQMLHKLMKAQTRVER